MAQYRIHDPDELLECPYERTHMVRAKRFQYHLMKCRKNYVGKDFSTCPFNAKHVMPKPEFRHHMATCPDKALIEPELSYAERKASGQDLRLKGCTETPVYNNMDIPSSEDWDTEVCPPIRVGPMHDPSYHSRVVFKDLSGMNKQQKAVMMDNRLTTEQKMAELKANAHESSVPKQKNDLDDGLRLPKTASATAIQPKPQAVQQPVSSVFTYSIGRGRGQVLQPQQEQKNPDTFSPVYGQGALMGVGRGMMGRGGGGSVAPPPGFCVPNVNQHN